VDVHLGIHYFDDFKARIEQTDSLLRELKDTDLGHSSELKKIDAAVEEIKLKRWQKNQEISERKSEKYETQRIVDRTENDLAHLRTEIQRLALETGELSLEESLRTYERGVQLSRFESRFLAAL